jgi:hypothetical protein
VTPLTVTPSTWRQCVEAGERFRRTANSAPELIVCNLADGSCEFVNDTWLQLGDGWQQVVHPGHGERFLSLYWEALQKASVSIFRTSDVAPQFQTGGENGLSHDVAQRLVSAGAETLLGAPGRWMPLAKRVEMSLVSTQQAGVPAPRKRAHPKFHGVRSSDLRAHCKFHDIRSSDLRVPLLRHDGLFRWMETSGAPQALKDGSFAGFVVSF